jgi:hypothetical protein
VRETVGSLRVYFLVFGVAGLLINLGVLFSPSILGIGLAVVSAVVYGAYAYVGLNLKTLIDRPWLIQRVLLASLVWSVVLVAVGVVQHRQYSYALLQGPLGVWYLSTSTRQVAVAEAAIRRGESPRVPFA